MCPGTDLLFRAQNKRPEKLLGVVLSPALGSWWLRNKDSEIPEVKNHFIY